MDKNLANIIADQITQIFKTSPTLPRDTRNFEIHGINAIYDYQGVNTAAVAFGGEKAFYAVYLNYNPYVGASSHPNRHFMFVPKMIENEIIPTLKMLYGG